MSEDRQIQSMIDFIEREAHEKAEELDQAAQEEYDVEKMRLVEAEKAKIRANLEKRKKQVEVDRRVARANHSKKQRLHMMEERGVILESLKEDIKKRILAKVQDTAGYKPMLGGLMRQAAAAVDSDSVVVCRKEDEQLVNSLVGETVAWFKSTHGRDITIEVCRTENLKSEEAWGGVIFRSTDGRITSNNTLSARLGHCFTEQLPRIRYELLDENCK